MSIVTPGVPELEPEPEWVKCLVCKTSGPIKTGGTFLEGIAKGNKCPYCGEEGLIRDLKAEAGAKAEKDEKEAEEAKKTELDEFMYPVPVHVFRKGPGCPSCGSHEGTFIETVSINSMSWSKSTVVLCDCYYSYMWPCVDIRTLDQPGEEVLLSPRDEEARVRKLRDDQLREEFG
jgi:hypothetical protein